MGQLQSGNRLQIRLLGTLEVTNGERSFDVGGPQQRAVLATLALEAGRLVPIERLIAVLWGEFAPKSAMNTLQSYISRLRTSLAPERAGLASTLVIGHSAGYVLAVEPTQVDASEFQRLAASGRDALHHGDHVVAEAELARAIALWRGPALTGANGEGVAALAVRLEEERLDTIADHADAQLALGRHDAVVPSLREAVESDPLHERLWARLALALYRSGRQVEAVRALASARDALADASGLIAGPELRTIEAQILAHDPALLGPVLVAPVLVGSESTPVTQPVSHTAPVSASAHVADDSHAEPNREWAADRRLSRVSSGAPQSGPSWTLHSSD